MKFVDTVKNIETFLVFRAHTTTLWYNVNANITVSKTIDWNYFFDIAVRDGSLIIKRRRSAALPGTVKNFEVAISAAGTMSFYTILRY